ncbi:HNH endonuclease [Leptospira santarosai]|nr:HNH endonuclease [Leptospira santarosai]
MEGKRLRLSEYRSFANRIVSERLQCESCRATTEEVGQKRLHIHHLMHVARLGLDDPAIIDEGNILVLCNHCHSLFHPGSRVYNWFLAGLNRGVQLAKT